MANIYMAMNTAKLGLLAHQNALQVTGNNIANVNNPNYSRQQLNLTAAHPVIYGNSPGMMGTGVIPTSIVRNQDYFLEEQRALNIAQQDFWDTRQSFMSRLEVTFNETDGLGLNKMFDNFFGAWQDLANHPQGLTERTAVVAQGESLATMFSKLKQDMTNIRVNLNSQVSNSVEEVNRITTEIAKLNIQIHESEGFNVNANDFRDKREELIRELSGYTKVRSVEDPLNNEVTVYLSTGRPLVIGQTTFNLEAQSRSDDPLANDLVWIDPAGGQTVITNEIKEGSLGAAIELRDVDIPAYLDKLDLLAANFARDINKLHGEGYGIDGSTGQNFFEGMTPAAIANSNNTGTGLPTVTVAAPDIVNNHKFEILRDAAGYTVTDLTTTAQVVAPGSAFGAVQTYFATQGLTVGMGGVPVVNDTFTINAAAGAARGIKVAAAVVTDIRKVAAGLTTDVGNGENALRLSSQQNALSMGQDTAGAAGLFTYAEHYNSLVGEVAISAKEATATYNQQEAVMVNLDARHQQISGVSIDEEMIDMVRFQHAYQANARMLGVVDELLQTLIGLGR